MDHKTQHCATRRCVGLVVTIVTLAMFVLLSSHASYAAEDLYYKPGFGLVASVGYSRVVLHPNLPRNLEFHSNHPADSFLAGDPGRTQLDAMTVSSLDFDLGMTRRLGGRGIALVASYVAHVPLQASGRAEHQQANDPRAASTASFVYTQLAGASLAHCLRAGLGVGFVISSNYGIGLEMQGLLEVGRSSMTFESGWSRFSTDEVARASTPSALGLTPLARMAVTAGKWSLYVSIGIPSVRFTHSASDLENHTGNGHQLAFGAQVAFDRRRR